MTIPIPTDPCAEADQRWQRIHPSRIIPRRHPCLAQMDVRTSQCLWEDLPQVVQRILQLRIDRWPRHMDLACAPETLEVVFKQALQPRLLTRCVGRVLVSVHQRVNFPMKLPHRLTLRLRRVSRQHRLHPHLAQHRQHLLLRQSHGDDVLQIVGPQPLLRLRTRLLFPQSPHLRGHPLLRHIQELKRNRVCLPQRPTMPCLQLFLATQPRQLCRQLRLPHPPQHSRKRLHQEVQFIFEQAKPVFAERGWRRHGGQ